MHQLKANVLDSRGAGGGRLSLSLVLWWFQYAWPIVGRIIRQCGLVGMGVTLLEEVCCLCIGVL